MPVEVVITGGMVTGTFTSILVPTAAVYEALLILSAQMSGEYRDPVVT